MQGLKLQQMSLLVAGLLAIAMHLLVADHAVAAGILLAVASIKPQLVVLLLLWLAIWTLADWRRRYRLGGFVSGHDGHLAGAPRSGICRTGSPASGRQFASISATRERGRCLTVDWCARAGAGCSNFWRSRRRWGLAGRNAGRRRTPEPLLSCSAWCWRTTVLIVPSSAPYNQVLLIPALLLLVKERRAIWRRVSPTASSSRWRAVLFVWPWIASMVLAGLSFVLPERTVERAWAVPLWTAIQTPVGVAALMLVHYYQRTFTAPPEPGTS